MAFSGSGFGSGAVGGAGLGSMFGPVGMGVGALAGGLMGAFGGGGGAKLEQGYDVVQMPQYSWTERNRGQLADYVAGGLQSIQEGNPPTWWKNAQPKLQQGMSRQNALTYFGSPGTRQGSVGTAMSMGAMAGLKGKRAMTPGNQQLTEYNNRESAINDYLTQLGVNVTQQSEQNYMNTIAGMPGGPETQIVNKMGGVSGGNNWADQLGKLGGTIAENLPWENMFKNQTTTQNNPYWPTMPMPSGYTSPTPNYSFGPSSDFQGLKQYSGTLPSSNNIGWGNNWSMDGSAIKLG